MEKSHRFHLVTEKGAREIADRMMSVLGIPYSRDTSVELFGPGDSGLRLDIRADRYFEINGDRYLVSYFNGDPVFYTLMRLLETRGYRVIILEEKDDFKKVVDKLLSRLRIPGSYGRHRLWPDHDLSYGVRMSGYLLRDPAGGKNIFIAGKEIDPLVKELAELNGYQLFQSREQ
jgi:hypothetical protein